MSKDELISQQALEIVTLRERVNQYDEAAKSIHNEIFCIGGPLNDNVQKYNRSQMLIFFRIIEHIEF